MAPKAPKDRRLRIPSKPIHDVQEHCPSRHPSKSKNGHPPQGKRPRRRISATAFLKAARPVVKPHLAESGIINAGDPELNCVRVIIPRIPVGFSRFVAFRRPG